VADKLTVSKNPQTRYEAVDEAIDRYERDHDEANTESAYREGHKDGYSQGLSDGQSYGRAKVNEDEDWKRSYAHDAAVRIANITTRTTP
jgi:flagellar biosynthesis/type III secretory pathway protein FliH